VCCVLFESGVLFCVMCIFMCYIVSFFDHLCGLVFTVPGYRSRGPEFDSWNYQIFWKVVGLERGPLSLVIKIEELLERKSSGSGLENRDYGRKDSSRCPRGTHPQTLALISLRSGCRSVGIVRSRTQATEFFRFEVLPPVTMQGAVFWRMTPCSLVKV
jgi:hypothetical protein